MLRPSNLLRPLVRGLHPYAPGEQPKVKGLIKLNTNENPYPPSPKVLAATRAALDGRLRLYPNSSADRLRERLARCHGCQSENIIIGNGSDELLALAVRAFVEPMSNLGAASWSRAANSRRSSSSVQYFWPSYSLYPVLAEAHGARLVAYPLSADFSLPTVKELRRNGTWDFRAALTFITTPHAPSGRGYSTAELEVLCRAMNGVVVLDEAYVDFADEDALELAKRYPHVLISRTFSKAYSLCFQRVGYFIGHPDLIAGLHRLRDSYNVNGLGQVAAEATLGDLGYYRRNFSRIKATRARLTRELTELGWGVLPSQTNFLLCLPPRWSAENWQDYLRQRKILVRWFNQPAVNRYLRITVGSEAESDRLLRTVRGRRGRSI